MANPKHLKQTIQAIEETNINAEQNVSHRLSPIHPRRRNTAPKTSTIALKMTKTQPTSLCDNTRNGGITNQRMAITSQAINDVKGAKANSITAETRITAQQHDHDQRKGATKRNNKDKNLGQVDIKNANNNNKRDAKPALTSRTCRLRRYQLAYSPATP